MDALREPKPACHSEARYEWQQGNRATRQQRKKATGERWSSSLSFNRAAWSRKLTADVMADVPGFFQHTRQSCHVRVYACERRLCDLVHLVHVNRQSAREETGPRWAAEFVGVVARELDSTGAQRVEMWRVHRFIMKSDVVPAQVVTEQYDDVGRPDSCDDCRDGEY